jgi:hypothetical protein
LVRLREGGQALTFARTSQPDAVARLPRERKVNYLLDLAEARWQIRWPVPVGDGPGCSGSLLTW